MDSDIQYIKGAVETLLFVSDKPVSIEQFKDVLEGVDVKVIRQAIAEIKNDYEHRQSGMVIVEIAGGYQMLSSPQHAGSVRAFYRTQKKEKLSKPALETLAIIAYKQPVTRVEVEMIRGVNSDGVVNHLLEKNLIKITGRKDVPGKPYVYGTTKEFLEYFGLRSLVDLPKLEEFETGQEGPQKIESFQQVSEQFREQAMENAPQQSFQANAQSLDADQELVQEESQKSQEDIMKEPEQKEEEILAAEELKSFTDIQVSAESEPTPEGGGHRDSKAS